ncbi:MAG: hypothetical protein RR416_04725 [Clostridia bacterium]
MQRHIAETISIIVGAIFLFVELAKAYCGNNLDNSWRKRRV